MASLYRLILVVVVAATPASLFLAATLSMTGTALAPSLIFALLAVIPFILAGMALAAPFLLVLSLLERRSVPYYLAIGTFVGAMIGGYGAFSLRDAPVEPFSPEATVWFALIGAGYGLWCGATWCLVFRKSSNRTAKQATPA